MTGRRRTFAHARLLVVAVALVLALPGGARADDRAALAAYDEGVAAVRAGRYEEGLTRLQAALAERKDGRFKVGVKFYDYYPTRWMAEAAAGLGQADRARTLLAQAEGVKSVSKEETAAVAALRARLEGGAKATAPSPATAAVAVASGPAVPARCPDADAARAALRAGRAGEARRLAQQCLQANPTDADARSILSATDDEVARRVREAQVSRDAHLLEDAQRQLEEALAIAPENTTAGQLLDQVRADRAASAVAVVQPKGATTTGPGPSTAPVAASAASPRSVQPAEQQAARVRLEAARAALASGSLDDAEEALAEAVRRDPALAATAEPLRTQIGAARHRADQLVASAEGALAADDPQRAQGAVDALAAAFPSHPQLAVLRARLAGGGPSVAAVEAYFRGDIGGCIAGLEASADKPDTPPRLLAVLASALATRAFTGAGQDADRDLGRATALFRQALARDKTLQLDRRYFSPRIVGVFDAAKKPAGPG